jgi:hypothetical protein
MDDHDPPVLEIMGLTRGMVRAIGTNLQTIDHQAYSAMSRTACITGRKTERSNETPWHSILDQAGPTADALRAIVAAGP